MTRKDYKAIAGALYRIAPSMLEQPHKLVTEAIAQVLMADNPLRFDRERFINACTTGKGIK